MLCLYGVYVSYAKRSIRYVTSDIFLELVINIILSYVQSARPLPAENFVEREKYIFIQPTGLSIP